MFWRKRKNSLDMEASDLSSLASRLGIERRRFVRIRYPNSHSVCKLPRIQLRGCEFKVIDISVGGCCLLDPKERLGPSIGHEVELEMHWATGVDFVKATIISRVDHRRHIQFQNLTPARQTLLRRFMAMGIRGLTVKHHMIPAAFTSDIDALEMWSSPQGDGVTLVRDMHRMAEIHFKEQIFSIYREAWPIKGCEKGGPSCSRLEFEQIILFLSNIPLPSDALKDLTIGLEEIFREARR